MTTVTVKKAKKAKLETKASFIQPLTTVEKPRIKVVKATPVPLGVDSRLFEMLSYKRPHGSKTERDWCEKFILPYQPDLYGGKEIDAYVVTVGSGSRTLFSAHVDTVHRSEGLQNLCYDPIKNHIFKDDGEPLGADDGAGVWLLLEMIDAGVPGVYCLTRGEECGGIGAKGMADYESMFLSQFDRAIAFDRRACDSIITHQAGGRCCSDAFALALADALNLAQPDFMYSPDDTGVYTDTAEYTGIIAECCNTSVGYAKEHTAQEMQDLDHLLKLRDACIRLDWEALPVVRDPSIIEAPAYASFKLGGWGKAEFSEFEADEWMTRQAMIDYAAADPEGFVDELRYYFYGDTASITDDDRRNH